MSDWKSHVSIKNCGGLAGKLILFSIPLAFSSILQQLFNSADVAVVGRFVGWRNL
ncbi:MAG: hypothetical protein MR355_07480 [Lachnospiraceae bacterium]|nr:hypothetical protein [Lachnospiraceae bacterium]